jgi:hypothetical protein
MDTPPSKSRVNRAGALLRKVYRGEIKLQDMTHDQITDALEAIDIAQASRSYAKPLLKVRMGLASFIQTCHVEGALGQRHKRLPRIAAKLARDGSTMTSYFDGEVGSRSKYLAQLG